MGVEPALEPSVKWSICLAFISCRKGSDVMRSTWTFKSYPVGIRVADAATELWRVDN